MLCDIQVLQMPLNWLYTGATVTNMMFIDAGTILHHQADLVPFAKRRLQIFYLSDSYAQYCTSLHL